MNCPKCQRIIDEGNQFCPYCGQSLYMSAETVEPSLYEPKKGKKKKSWIIGLCVAEIILIAIVIAVVVMKPGFSKKGNGEALSQTEILKEQNINLLGASWCCSEAFSTQMVHHLTFTEDGRVEATALDKTYLGTVDIGHEGTIIMHFTDEIEGNLGTAKDFYVSLEYDKEREVLSVKENPSEEGSYAYGNEFIKESDEDKEVKYRVRQGATDEESQIGAFAIFENAKKEAENNKNYKVYSMGGTQVYIPQ